jgi:eukaryotic-like serine/threonine-protein kinase
MSVLSRCPVCGTPLPLNRLVGLCPACTWRSISDVDAESPAPVANATSGIALAVPGHIVLEEIARGGMGIVYRARQLDPERTVALKMMLPHQSGSAEFRERFHTEVRALTGLDHSNILPVYLVSEHEGMPFFTMKLATGGTLAQHKSEFAGRWREIAGLIATVADAVGFAHERGVLHRDLKPGNILFDDTRRPYVSDFGLAKLVSTETDLTRSSDFLGTPHYVAPEVATRSARQATTSSDIYSLGAILYELLAGRPPFEAEGLPGLLKKIAEDDPAKPVADVPRDLGVICLKCLAKEPARRYTSARDLADELRRWLDGRPILARPASPVERAWFWVRRYPALASLSALLVITLTVGALLQTQSNRSLRQALAESHAAHATAQDNLQQSLVAQGRAERTTGRIGQRHHALEAITKAAQIRPSLEARNEAAAALATPDLRFIQTVPRFFANAESTMGFSSDLGAYVSGRLVGGFMLRFPTNDGVSLAFATNHASSAHQLKMSEDGRFATATYVSGDVEVWSLKPRRLVWQRAAGEVSPIIPAFGPQSDGFVFAQTDGSVAWQSLATDQFRVLTPPGAKVLGVSLAPTATALAVVREGVLEVQDFATNQMLWKLSGEFSTPEPAWSHDGGQLAVGDGSNDRILLLNGKTGAVERELQAEGLKPTLLCFHPDGRRLASVGANRFLRMWDTQTGAIQWQGGAAPRVLQFSADGRKLAFAPGHLEAALAELAPEDVWRELRGEPSRAALSSSVVVSADNRLVATCGAGEIRIWDARLGRQIQAFPFVSGALNSTFFHPDRRSLIYSAIGHGIFRRELRQSAGTNEGPVTLELGPEETLASARHGFLTSLGREGRQWLIERRETQQVALWPDGEPERERVLMAGHRFNGASLSPDGRWLATLTAPLPGVEIWNATNATLFTNLVLRGHGDCAFSTDSRYLLTGTAMDYRLWATTDWSTVTNRPATLNGQSTGREFFSPSGDQVAVLQDRGSLQICDPRNLRELITLEPPKPVDIASVAWSPDGRQLYVLGAHQRLYVWDLAKLHQELATMGLDW